MDNNLRNLEKDLRAFAKRNQNVTYTKGLLMTFLITGTISLSTWGAVDTVQAARQGVNVAVTDMRQTFSRAREENKALLKDANLELIQLMEQGDHVVKSPWSSWQFGINTFLNESRGSYKGRGDKKEKYPYEGVYRRSSDLLERGVSPISTQYSQVTKSSDRTYASTSGREGLNSSSYGLAGTKYVTEPIVGFEVNANVKPKQVAKSPITIAAKDVATPTLPTTISFTPPAPKIIPPDKPFIPNAPSFSIILGADCNVGCSSGQPRQARNGNFDLNGRAVDSIQSILHYTWGNNTNNESLYAFKMYTDTDTNFTLGTDIPHNTNGLTTPAGTNVYFNSYNFGDNDEFGVIANSQGIERNHQHFFVGGSRFIESDNAPTSGNTISIPTGYTVNLGGILTLGLVSQGHNTTQLNGGTITDKEEKNDKWIKEMPYDTTGAGAGKYLTIHGPGVDYHIKRSEDGYVGYKVGIALVQEDAVNGGKILNDTSGIIDFRGERSIGLYTYLPTQLSDRDMENKGTINLSGSESYGMKYAATEKTAGSIDFLNSGTINLRQNPDGVDKADNSIGMAVTTDPSVTAGVSLGTNQAKNTGTINLTNVKDSSGMYVNIDSDMTNETGGKIVINSTINTAPAGQNQSVNIGMRSDGHANAKVINKGDISLEGSYAIGMLTRGSNIDNQSTIGTTGTATISNGSGIIGIGGTVNNTGTITLKGSKDNIGIYLSNGANGTTTGDITIEGKNSTGIFSDQSTLTYNSGITKVTGTEGLSGIVVTGGTAQLNGGSIVVGDATSYAKESTTATGTKKGSYGLVVDGGATVTKTTGTGTNVTAYVDGSNSVGIYANGNTSVGNTNIYTQNGAVNYMVTNGNTLEIGNGGVSTAETGQSSLLFYTGDTGKITLNDSLNAKVLGGTTTATRGTAFYYTGTPNTTLVGALASTPSAAGNYANFTTSDMNNWINGTFNNTSTSKLSLDMQPGSRLFLATGVSTNLSSATPTTINADLTGGTGSSAASLNAITGTDYIPFMLYHSLLNIDPTDNVNLDSATDPYVVLNSEMANSSIINNGTISGTQVNQVAMAQENDTFGTGTPSKGIVTLTNNGTINLSGTGSTAMYTDYGYLINNGTISVGDNSTAMYGLNDTEISNNTGATINLGSNSTAMYSKGATNVGLVNEGTISTAGDNSIAMAYEPATSGQTVENKGTITMTGDKNTGIYATDAQLEANSKALAAGTYTGSLPLTSATTYTAKNSGTITLGDSASLNNPNVGIYAKNENVTSENAGTITSGNNTVGIFGYAANNTGDITVGDNAIALYSKGGNINLNGGTITVGQGQAVGVYTEGTGQTITNNSTAFNIGDTSYGFVNVGTGNTINSNYTGTVNLVNDGVYIYTNDTTGTVNNHTNLFASGLNGRNYGIYGAGTINNWGNMDFRGGKGNIGVYSINGGDATNYGVIEIGQSNIPSGEYGVGMAAGYKGDATTPATTGKVTNKGIIRINEKYGIGLYATGVGSVATNDTGGVIELNADNTSGIYVENGANAINNGTITTGSVGGLKQVSGVVLGTGSTLTNNGTITIDATKGVGIYLKGGTVANYGTLNVTGSGSQAVYDYTNSSTGKTITVNGASVVGINAPAGATSATITANGNPVTPTMITTTNQNPTTVSANSIGMYVNTSGTAFTNPIGGLGALTNEADLIIGAEAGDGTNSKYIQINDPNILGPYNASIAANPQVTNWNVYSGSLTWLATVTLNNSTGSTQIGNIYMAKVPYTVFTTDTDTYNFADGLEQRYDMNALNSREKLLFNKLNSIGNNEEILLYQAYDEMMGHQYANAQQRINHTGNLLDKEFKYLYDQWETKSKQSNKLKVFGMRDEYNTDTAGIIDYTNNAYGVAYLHEDETVKLGDTTGWYAGAVHNRFRFKDIGGSKEEQTMLKAGIFKSTAFDDNNSLNWTIAGELFGGINEMRRRYLVVDDVFGAESKYYSYGVGLKNQISKTFRTGEKTFLKPYASLDMEYGRMTKIKEKTGEVRLEVGSNDYYSIKPELGVEFKYKTKFGKRSTFITSLGVAYENELGKVAGTNNKARVGYTNADWFNLRSEKDNRSGNFKADLNLGIENTRVGFTANLGYDTVGKNIRGGLGIRAIY